MTHRAQTDEGLPDAPAHRPPFTPFVPFLLLFAAYPVALVVPVRLGVPLTYEWALPVFLALAAFSMLGLVAVSVAERPPLRGLAMGGLVLAVALSLLSALVNTGFEWRAVIAASGALAVPLYFATCRAAWLPGGIPLLLGTLWLVHVAHGLWQWSAGFSLVGVTGNPNWMAALLVALLPWPVLAVRDIGAGRGWPQAARLTVAVLVPGALTAALWSKTGCRATILAVLVYGVWWLFWRLRRPRWRAAFAAFAALVVLGAGFLFQNALRNAAAEDIRLPCWRGTVEMISESPWLGVGPGQFRRVFPAYRTAAQKSRSVSGDITEHPHNQWLYLASVAGVPFAVLSLLLLVPLVLPPSRSPFLRAMHFSTLILVVHAFFDKQMVQPPDSLLACIGIGFLWRPMVERRRSPTASRSSPSSPLAHLPLLCLLLLGWLGYAVDWPAGTARRAARLDHLGERPGEAVQHYVNAGEITGNAKDFLLAGTVAVTSLQNPAAAVACLEWSVVLEPLLGHTHLYLGLAHGRLGNHPLAREHFALEARLYPHSPAAHQLLLNSRLECGILKGAPGVVRRIGDLRTRRLRQQLGTPTIQREAKRFLDAVKQSDFPAAKRSADALLQPLAVDMFEPVPSGLPPPPRDFRPAMQNEFTRSDFNAWKTWIAAPDALRGSGTRLSVTPVEFRCRNQALCQILSRVFPARWQVPHLSPAARLEALFLAVGVAGEYEYREPSE